MATSFDIIATRNLVVVDEAGQPVKQVFVHLGRPMQEPTGEWSISYQIVGLGSDSVYHLLGIDAVQALQLVHKVIGGILAGTSEAKAGRLQWDGGTGSGFPEPPESLP